MSMTLQELDVVIAAAESYPRGFGQLYMAIENWVDSDGVAYSPDHPKHPLKHVDDAVFALQDDPSLIEKG
jgi:hypothetical protein